MQNRKVKVANEEKTLIDFVKHIPSLDRVDDFLAAISRGNMGENDILFEDLFREFIQPILMVSGQTTVINGIMVFLDGRDPRASGSMLPDCHEYLI